jgi:hypothetical protein
MKDASIPGALFAGVLGTAVMTALTFMAPRMGMPEMNIPKMLAGTMGLPISAGWLAHFMIGVVLALIYAYVFYSILPGPPIVKGLIFSLFPWLMAQLLVMPMTMVLNGMPFSSGIFSGSALMAMGSLIGHLVYGFVVGLVYKPVHLKSPAFKG